MFCLLNLSIHSFLFHCSWIVQPRVGNHREYVIDSSSSWQWYSGWNGSDRQENKPLQSRVCSRDVHNTRTVKANLYSCSWKSEPLVLSSWIWSVWFVLSCIIGMHSEWERDFFLICRVKKKEKEQIFWFTVIQATALTPPTLHLIWDLSAGTKPFGQGSCSVESHFTFVQFSVQFSSVMLDPLFERLN